MSNREIERTKLNKYGNVVHVVHTVADTDKELIFDGASATALTIKDAISLDQSLQTTDSPTFATVNCTTVSASGAITCDTMAATSAVSGASLAVTGAITHGTVATHEAVVTVGTTAILALAASPAEIVAAPGANKYIQFLGGAVALDFGTTAFDDAAGDGDLVLRSGTTNTNATAAVEADGLVDAAADKVTTANALEADRILDANESLELFNDGAEFTAAGGGDGALKVYVRYRIIDLS